MLTESAKQAARNYQALPPQAVALLPSTGELITITKGDPGYRRIFEGEMKGKIAAQMGDDLNAHLGVTFAQRDALFNATILGIGSILADPFHPLNAKAVSLTEKLPSIDAARQVIDEASKVDGNI